MSQTRDFFDKSEFVYSAEELRHHPVNDHAVPEIVILGASNAGKSTLLNRLFNKTNMARVSNQPGKTTLMNAYGIGKPLTQTQKTTKIPRNLQYGLIMMDTPGYGFGSRAEWGTSILSYLEKRKALRGALLLLSAEKNLGAEDEWILTQLAHASTSLMIVLTKADKVESIRRTEQLQQLARKVGRVVTRMEEELNVKIQLEICVTANLGKKTSSQDMSGLRLAIMEMASLSVGNDKVKQTQENTQYTGEVVSFDDIRWKN